MKAYVITTGSVFGLLVLAHVWRVIEEGPRLATDPTYILITAVARGIAVLRPLALCCEVRTIRRNR